jgi:hypothetical protein
MSEEQMRGMVCSNCKHLVQPEGDEFSAYRTYQCAAQMPTDLPIPGHMWRIIGEMKLARSRSDLAWFSPSSVTECRTKAIKE